MKFLKVLTVACLFSSGAWAQTLLPGALLPALPQQFLNANGAPAANGRLCTQASGTNTALAVYSDPQLTMPLPNPIKLNAAGIATTNGTTETAVYTSAASYRVTLYGPNSGGIGTCNGQAVGALIWQFDNIYDFGQLNGNGGSTGGGGSAHPCVTGADMAAKITAAYSTLPASGGIIDCSNLTTPQSLGTDPFTGMTTPVTVIFPVVTSTSTVALNVPSNVTLLLPQGAILANSNKENIAGRIDAGNWQIFSGSGQVCFGISTVCNITNGFTPTALPEWWGALGNGLILGGSAGTTGCNGTGGTNILSCAAASFSAADVGKVFDIDHGGASNCGQRYSGPPTTFNCNLVGTISAVTSSTQITISVNLSNSVSNEQLAYGTPDDNAFKPLLSSGAKNIQIARTYVIHTGLVFQLDNITITSPGPTLGRFLGIGAIAYGPGFSPILILDNGSQNVQFNGVGFLGTNNLGELTNGPTGQTGLYTCPGIPNFTIGGFSCNAQSGLSNISFKNCDFSHFWGIGMQANSGTTVGQQFNGLYIVSSSATWNSYDGFNPSAYDNILLDSDVSMFNQGGVEAAPFGKITVVGGQYIFNRAVGIAIGGINDNVTHMGSCEINSNDISENGNGYSGSTMGTGLSLSFGIQNCTVTGNTFRHNHLYGIQAQEHPQDQNYTISGNMISTNGISTASQQPDGIFGGLSGATITGNNIVDEGTNVIATATRTSNVVTVTTTWPHNYLVGYTVTIAGTTGAAFDGTWTITAIVDGLNFKFAQTASNIGPLTGGSVTSTSSGFSQWVGIEISATSRNSLINSNYIQHNSVYNIEIDDATNAKNITVQSNNNFPSASDIKIIAGTPSLTGVTIRIPDIQTTGNVCTTAASAGAVCTTVITHNLGTTPNTTVCELDNTPNAQAGEPVLIKSDSSTSASTSTITIGALTASAAGGGTMRCKTNYAY